MNVSRSAGLTALLLLVLASLAAASAARLQSKRAFAQNAATNYAKCQKLAAEIEALQATPLQASLQQQETREIALSVQKAAQDAEIPAGGVFRVTPIAERRVKDTPYLEQGTRLDLRNVTLEQLVKFLTEVTAQQTGMQVTSLRLTAPRTGTTAAVASEDQPDRWTVEATLTYLIFSPKTQARLPQ